MTRHGNTTTDFAPGRRAFIGVLGAVGAGTAAAAISAPAAEAAALDNAVIYVEDYPATNDSISWQNAINAAIANGVRTVMGTKTRYELVKEIDVSKASNITIKGAGADATLITARDGYKVDVAFLVAENPADKTPLVNLTFRDFSIDGRMTSTHTSFARDERTYATNTILRAGFKIYGRRRSTNPSDDVTANREVRNVTVKNVSIYGTTGYPAFFSGVRGNVTMQDCYVERCLDTGFVYNESVHYTGNRVEWSADNGVSLSRGNDQVLCHGNSFFGCYFVAIWVAGFANENVESNYGPDKVVVSSNIGTYCQQGGIYASSGPGQVTIVGNTMSDMIRGINDDCGTGIVVTGFPIATVATTTHPAKDILISGNNLVDCARGGIAIYTSENVTVTGNQIIRPGSQFFKDGTTPVVAQGGLSNYGIAIPGDGPKVGIAVKNVVVHGNTIMDDRSPTLLKWGTYHPYSPTWQDRSNIVIGAEKPYADTPYALPNESSIGLPTNSTTSVFIDGAAAAYRSIVWRTAGLRRWVFRTTNAAETATNGGADLQLLAYANDGSTTTGTALTIRRSDGAVSFGVPPRVPPLTTASRPTAAVARAGACYFDTSLKKPIWSDGATWRDATGKAV